MIQVQLLYHTEYDDCFAFFPYHRYSDVEDPGYGLFKSYTTTSKFSPCHVSYLDGCRMATASEYFNVYMELREIYGDKLVMLKYNPISNWIRYKSVGYLNFEKLNTLNK